VVKKLGRQPCKRVAFQQCPGQGEAWGEGMPQGLVTSPATPCFHSPCQSPSSATWTKRTIGSVFFICICDAPEKPCVCYSNVFCCVLNLTGLPGKTAPAPFGSPSLGLEVLLKFRSFIIES